MCDVHAIAVTFRSRTTSERQQSEQNRPGATVLRLIPFLPTFLPVLLILFEDPQSGTRRNSAPRRLQSEPQRQRRKTTLIGSPIQPTKTAKEKSPTFRRTENSPRKAQRASRVTVDSELLYASVLPVAPGSH